MGKGGGLAALCSCFSSRQTATPSRLPGDCFDGSAEAWPTRHRAGVTASPGAVEAAGAADHASSHALDASCRLEGATDAGASRAEATGVDPGRLPVRGNLGVVASAAAGALAPMHEHPASSRGADDGGGYGRMHQPGASGRSSPSASSWSLSTDSSQWPAAAAGDTLSASTSTAGFVGLNVRTTRRTPNFSTFSAVSGASDEKQQALPRAVGPRALEDDFSLMIGSPQLPQNQIASASHAAAGPEEGSPATSSGDVQACSAAVPPPASRRATNDLFVTRDVRVAKSTATKADPKTGGKVAAASQHRAAAAEGSGVQSQSNSTRNTPDEAAPRRADQTSSQVSLTWADVHEAMVELEVQAARISREGFSGGSGSELTFAGVPAATASYKPSDSQQLAALGASRSASQTAASGVVAAAAALADDGGSAAAATATAAAAAAAAATDALRSIQGQAASALASHRKRVSNTPRAAGAPSQPLGHGAHPAAPNAAAASDQHGLTHAIAAILFGGADDDGADDTSAAPDTAKAAQQQKQRPPALTTPLSDITHGTYHSPAKSTGGVLKLTGGLGIKGMHYSNPAFSGKSDAPPKQQQPITPLDASLRRSGKAGGSTYARHFLPGAAGAHASGLTRVAAMPVSVHTPAAVLPALMTPNPLYSASSRDHGSAPPTASSVTQTESSLALSADSASIAQQSSSWVSSATGARNGTTTTTRGGGAAEALADTANCGAGRQKQQKQQQVAAAAPAAASESGAAEVHRHQLTAAAAGLPAPSHSSSPSKLGGGAAQQQVVMGPLTVRRPPRHEIRAAVVHPTASSEHQQALSGSGGSVTSASGASPLISGPLSAHNPLRNAGFKASVMQRNTASPSRLQQCSSAATAPVPTASGAPTSSSAEVPAKEAAAGDDDASAAASKDSGALHGAPSLRTASKLQHQPSGSHKGHPHKSRMALPSSPPLTLPSLQLEPGAAYAAHDALPPRSPVAAVAAGAAARAAAPYVFSPPDAVSVQPLQRGGDDGAAPQSVHDALDTLAGVVAKMVPGYKFSSPVRAKQQQEQATAAAAAVKAGGQPVAAARALSFRAAVATTDADGYLTPSAPASPARTGTPYTFTPPDPAATPRRDPNEVAREVHASVLAAIGAIQGCLTKMNVTPDRKAPGSYLTRAAPTTAGAEKGASTGGAAQPPRRLASHPLAMQDEGDPLRSLEEGDWPVAESGLGRSRPGTPPEERAAAARLWQDSTTELPPPQLMSPPMTALRPTPGGSSMRGERPSSPVHPEDVPAGGGPARRGLSKRVVASSAAGGSSSAAARLSTPGSPLSKRVHAILHGSMEFLRGRSGGKGKSPGAGGNPLRNSSPSLGGGGGGGSNLHRSSPGALPARAQLSASLQAALDKAQPRRKTDSQLPPELLLPDSPTLPRSAAQSISAEREGWSLSDGVPPPQRSSQEPDRRGVHSSSESGRADEPTASVRSSAGARRTSDDDVRSKRRDDKRTSSQQRRQQAAAAAPLPAAKSAMDDYADALAQLAQQQHQQQYPPVRGSFGGTMAARSNGAPAFKPPPSKPPPPPLPSAGGFVLPAPPQHLSAAKRGAASKSRLSRASVDWVRASHQGALAVPPPWEAVPSADGGYGRGPDQQGKARHSTFKIASPFKRQMQLESLRRVTSDEDEDDR